MEKFLSQNAHQTKNFIKLVTEHLMKSEKKIDGHFPSLGKNEFAYIRNPFTANTWMLQARTGTNWSNSNMMVLHSMCTLKKYSSEREFLVYGVQLLQKIATSSIQALLLLSS